MTRDELATDLTYAAVKWTEDDGDWDMRYGDDLVGRVVMTDHDDFRWHCNFSDWKGSTGSVDEAKLECELSFWREKYQTLRDMLREK